MEQTRLGSNHMHYSPNATTPYECMSHNKACLNPDLSLWADIHGGKLCTTDDFLLWVSSGKTFADLDAKPGCLQNDVTASLGNQCLHLEALHLAACSPPHN